ncbi:uncharacterized protein LOC129570887 [Sitodiplosis mosellana]|uniref:uncharacterized protein LOC129570887 n=1 Tax=Sitodiplosis mosellana TaxID=263140 RepID=UPI002444797D|nr:uncharacterized protein LOC129570887 [Sitodiplosis mosellana]
MQPFVNADFENKEDDKKFRSIGDLIKNHHKCTHLYPGMISKDKAFGEYFTQPNATKKGYVPKQYTFLAPPEENAVSSSSSPSSTAPSSTAPSSTAPSSDSPSSANSDFPFPSFSVPSSSSSNSTQNWKSSHPAQYPSSRPISGGQPIEQHFQRWNLEDTEFYRFEMATTQPTNTLVSMETERTDFICN